MFNKALEKFELSLNKADRDALRSGRIHEVIIDLSGRAHKFINEDLIWWAEKYDINNQDDLAAIMVIALIYKYRGLNFNIGNYMHYEE